MTIIDRGSPIPIYHQLKTLIREQIESGLWRPGDRIPTEKELCREHGISRSPVRQALYELAAEGLLVRRAGLGTFVNHHTTVNSSVQTSIQVMILESSNWSAVLDCIAQAWNVMRPEQVAFQTEVVSHAEFYGRLSAAVGSGTAPDVALVDSVWVAGLARSGFLYPFESAASPQRSPALLQDLSHAVVQANSYAGTLYALPCSLDASLLWYRKDWFAQEGLAPPQDWTDLVDVASHFLRPTVRERYGLAYPLAFPGGTAGGEATVYALMPFIWSAGGDVCALESVVLDSPGTRGALHFLRELVTRHRVCPADVVNYRWDTVPGLFARGKLAMALGGSYEAAAIRDMSGWAGEAFAAHVGSTFVPAVPGGTPVSTLGGTSYAVLRQSQHPSLVMELLQVATDTQVVGDWYASMGLASPRVSGGPALPSGDTLRSDVVQELVAAGRARPAIPDYAKVSRQLQAMFEAIFTTSVPVDQVARRTAEFIGVISERPCHLG